MKCYTPQRNQHTFWWNFPEDGIVHVWDFADGMVHGKVCLCGEEAFDMSKNIVAQNGELRKHIGFLIDAIDDARLSNPWAMKFFEGWQEKITGASDALKYPKH